MRTARRRSPQEPDRAHAPGLGSSPGPAGGRGGGGRAPHAGDGPPHDSLGGSADTPTGHRHYPLPGSADPLPADLLADAAGPILSFLQAADGLAEFVVWAQDVFAGQEHPGWWGRYRPVIPQGTGPLQAAAFAAAMLDDPELVAFLTARVENEEVDEHRLDDFRTDIANTTRTRATTT